MALSKRTELSFSSESDIWETVSAWAKQNGYRLKNSEGSDRTFQKGVGFWVAPMMLRIVQEGPDVQLTTWVRFGIIVRIFSFGILSAEMGVESGGFRGIAPRAIARKAVNNLLQALGQPPIV